MRQGFLLLFFFVICALNSALAQKSTITLTSECGKVIESEFLTNNEAQDVQIRMKAGDSFEVNIVPVGNYLKVLVQVLDPSGAIIIDWRETHSMYDTNAKSLLVKSQVLSASGAYTIKIYNHDDRKLGKAGAYTAYIKCTKRDGEIISPK